MSHHKYIAIIFSAAAISWLGLLLVLNKLSPYESMEISLSLFFLTLFVALSCTFSVIGFYFRLWLFKNEIFYRHINVSLRQGLLLSLIAVFSLTFQMLRVLNWLSGFLLLFIVVLIELYFSNRDSTFS